jgi:ATP phosphoribosyltransferase
MSKKRLQLAIQKSGRLSQGSLDLLKACGIKVRNGGKLKAPASNFPIDLLYLRDDDIPQYVEEGVADIGILGDNVVREKGREVQTISELGFSKCRLSLAVPREDAPAAKEQGLNWFEGKKVASSYPGILSQFFEENGIKAETEAISGSVEIAPGIGLADAVCDIVSTGSTLLANGLVETRAILKSEAVLIVNPSLDESKQNILDSLLFRIKAVRKADQSKYILMNAPNDKLDAIAALIPGMKAPTILPLSEPGWSSLHSVVPEDRFWEVIDKLREYGAEGILVCPIEKMIV